MDKRSPKKLFRKLEDWYLDFDEDINHDCKKHERNVHKQNKGRIRQYLKREAKRLIEEQ